MPSHREARPGIGRAVVTRRCARKDTLPWTRLTAIRSAARRPMTATVWWIMLARRADCPEAPPRCAPLVPAAGAQAASGAVVLVVEDDADIAAVLCETLLGEGHRVALAANMDTALATLATAPVVLVLADTFHDARRSAAPWTALDRLRASPTVPAIICSAHGRASFASWSEASRPSSRSPLISTISWQRYAVASPTAPLPPPDWLLPRPSPQNAPCAAAPGPMRAAQVGLPRTEVPCQLRWPSTPGRRV